MTRALYCLIASTWRRYNTFAHDAQNEEDLDTLRAACDRAMNGQADVKMQTTADVSTGIAYRVFKGMDDDTANGPSWQTGMVSGRGWRRPSFFVCLATAILLLLCACEHVQMYCCSLQVQPTTFVALNDVWQVTLRL